MKTRNKNHTLELYDATKNINAYPPEIFQYIVSFVPSQHALGKSQLTTLRKSRVAEVCKSFYQSIYGPQGIIPCILKCRTMDAQAITTEVKIETDDITQIINKRYRILMEFPLEEIAQIFFKKEINMNAMFMYPFSTKVLTEVFRTFVSQKILFYYQYVFQIQSLITSKTTSLEIKINSISFLLNLWDIWVLQFEVRPALTTFALLFLSSSKVQSNHFGTYFKSRNVEWLNDKSAPIPPQILEPLQDSAWSIMLNNYNNPNLHFACQTPIVISAGLILLSDNFLPERQTEALKILSTISSMDKVHSNVLVHIATIIILLNQYTEGGIKNLMDDEIAVYMEIFRTLKQRTLKPKNTKLIKEKVTIIEKFMPKRAPEKRLPDDALYIEQPPIKKKRYKDELN